MQSLARTETALQGSRLFAVVLHFEPTNRQ